MGMFNSKVKLRARIQKNNNFASSVKYRMDIYVQVFISHNGCFTTLQVKSNNEMEVKCVYFDTNFSPIRRYILRFSIPKNFKIL